MNVRVVELCSYGETADYQAFDIDAAPLDLDFTPKGWGPKGGNVLTKKFTKDGLEIIAYAEGRLTLFGAPSGYVGREMCKELFLLWPRKSMRID